MGSMIVSWLFYGSIGDVIILTLFRKIRKVSAVAAATPVASHTVSVEERTLFDVVSGIPYYTGVCFAVSIICKSGFVSMR